MAYHYTIFLYDKDNDEYSHDYVCKTLEEAETIAEALHTFVSKDLIVNRDNNNEPYDWIEIWECNENTLDNRRVKVY